MAGFDVTADAYGQFMGRWSEPLAGPFADRLSLGTGMRALDVGCGPGALTAVLADRLGEPHVVAVDPSSSFVSALRSRLPGVDVRESAAESLPFDDDGFDVAAAQLVVHFMSDPVAGLREMARVVAPGGLVATCVWDHAGRTGPLTLFWDAVHSLDPDAQDESRLPGSAEGHLVELSREAGLTDVESSVLTVRRTFASVDEWWQPFTYGVGPAGGFVARLDDRARDAVRARCGELLPDAPFELTSSAWCATGRVPAAR